MQFFDIVSRYYYPRKVTFIYIPNEKYNPYLLECFNSNLDFIIHDLKGKLHYWVANFLKIFIIKPVGVTTPKNTKPIIIGETNLPSNIPNLVQIIFKGVSIDALINPKNKKIVDIIMDQILYGSP